jgi:hypothetical protein
MTDGAEIIRAQLRAIRRRFRTIATVMDHEKTSGAEDGAIWAVVDEGTPSLCREARAIADLADQWLRSRRMPSADEWASLTHRVQQVAATTQAWAEEMKGPGGPTAEGP